MKKNILKKRCGICNKLINRQIRNKIPEVILHNKVIACDYCGLWMQMRQLTTHLNTICTKYVVHCKYHALGCKWHGPRETLQSHTSCDINNDVVQHNMHAYVNDVSKFTKQLADVKKFNNEINTIIRNANIIAEFKLKHIWQDLSHSHMMRTKRYMIFNNGIISINIETKDNNKNIIYSGNSNSYRIILTPAVNFTKAQYSTLYKIYITYNGNRHAYDQTDIVYSEKVSGFRHQANKKVLMHIPYDRGFYDIRIKETDIIKVFAFMTININR